MLLDKKSISATPVTTPTNGGGAAAAIGTQVAAATHDGGNGDIIADKVGGNGDITAYKVGGHMMLKPVIVYKAGIS